MSLAIGFSGQGMQYPAMFNHLKNHESGFNWLSEACNYLQLNIFDEQVVKTYCTDPLYNQCLLALLAAGSFQMLNLKPDLLCGYSLGELSAFCVSANLSIKQIIDVSKKRAQLMFAAAQKALSDAAGGLAVLKGNVNLEQATCLARQHHCYMAIINGDDHYIVGGAATDLDSLILEASQSGIRKAELLTVSVPAHTPLLAEASQQFIGYLQLFKNYPMSCPILNALSGELIVDTDKMLGILAAELSQTLDWVKVMNALPEYGIDTFIEIGPQHSLKKMFQSSNPTLKAYSIDDFSSLAGMITFWQAKNS